MRSLYQLQSHVKDMKPGEKFFIDLTISPCWKLMLTQIRQYIEEGILKLDEAALADVIIESQRDLYRSGWRILEKMTYVKQ